MKIEKIKNFNQVILAIAGILGIMLLLAIIIQMAPDILWRWDFGSKKSSTITNSLISEEEAKALNQENLRLQIISYETPKLIDTVNVVYIIPVSVSTLDKPETVVDAATYGNGLMALYDYHAPIRKEGYYEENYFEGLFANLIVYSPIADKTSLLFNERIMLTELRTYNLKEDILLIFFTAEKDTNKDGLINFNDDKNLCIYSLRTEKMHRIAEGTNSITDYQFVENSKDLLIEFSLSQYNDVKFESFKPRKIMKYEFETEQLSEIIPTDIQQQMQNLIESKNSQ